MERQNATVTAVVRKELRKKTDWKYTDHSATAVNVYSSGTITSLYSNLVRGDTGYNNFDGNVVRPQAITLKYYAHTSQLRNCVRVMLFQWFDSSVPALSGVLQHTGATQLPVVSPTLITNKGFLKVLYDRSHQFAKPNDVDTEGVTDVITVYIPGKRLRQTRFNSGANTVQEGCLYLLVVSDDLAVPSPQITWVSRVTFADGA